MLVMYRKNNLLHAKVMMDLKLDIVYQGVNFGKGKQERLLLPEEVMCILQHNGNIRIFKGDKFVKLNLGQFYDLYVNQKFVIEDVVEKPIKQIEPKVEVKKEEPVVQPKVEEKKVEEIKIKEEPKVEEKKVEQQPKKHEQNENKKQRHNNNKQQNQGGDK